jgi:hypothetical protein
MSIGSLYNEALHFVIHNWHMRHASPRHFKLVRDSLRDMRAAKQLGFVP